MTQDKNSNKKKQTPSKKKPAKNFLRYSGLGVQMLATILIGVFLGIFLDDYFQVENHIFTLLLTIVFVFLALYFGIKGILRD